MKVTLAEWERGMEKAGLDTDFYAHQKWWLKQELPWQASDPKKPKVDRPAH